LRAFVPPDDNDDDDDERISFIPLGEFLENIYETTPTNVYKLK
jgi:hypothetical protein